MTSCCDTGVGFPSATLMDQLGTNHPLIWKEICGIQQAVLAAASTCSLPNAACVTVPATTPMTWVSGLTSVSVINGGAGYVLDQPAARFKPPSGSTVTSPASANVITNGGSIIGVNIIDGGQGYTPRTSTLDTSSVAGQGAILNPYVDSSTGVVGVDIIDGGVGFAIGDSVYGIRARPYQVGMSDAVITVTNVSVTGRILDVTIVNPGTGYDPSVTELEIVSQFNPNLLYPVGAGVRATVSVDTNGAITGVTITQGGSGYVALPPKLIINDPGYGAVTQVSLINDGVSSVSVISGGAGYSANPVGQIINPVTAPAPVFDAVVGLTTTPNPHGTDPGEYYRVWQNTVTNRLLSAEMTTVATYFRNLGYTVSQITNPTTGVTFQWHICW